LFFFVIARVVRPMATLQQAPQLSKRLQPQELRHRHLPTR
jgi:hypothetical protein